LKINQIAILILLSVQTSLAQYEAYDKKYFLFPIKYGKKNYLSGSMGELRTNHFHGGLDIKTDQRTGLPVYASASGYVSRIVISSKGYGNTLYITHPNRLTTVYAHLEWFNGEIGRFIKNHLYKEQCNEIDMILPKDKFTFKQSDTIAWSGNTGSSGGPHLHWEIRDANEKLLNPMFFDFYELDDNIPPFINKIALRTMDYNAKIEGEFGRKEFIPQKINKDYVLKFPIHLNGWIGLEINTCDRMDNTGNFYGVNKIELFFDGRLIFTHDIQQIGFDENPYINTHVDFETALIQGNKFQKCYRNDGNQLGTYKHDFNNGKFLVNDSLIHEVKVKVYDSYRNATSLNFRIKGIKFTKNLTVAASINKNRIIHTEEHENILKIETLKSLFPLNLFIKDRIIKLDADYYKSNIGIGLWDLRKGLPDSIITKDGFKHKFNYHQLIPSDINYTSIHPKIEVHFPKKSIFDTLYLVLGYKENMYTIHTPKTPLYSPFTVVLKPEQDFANKSKYAVYNVIGKTCFKYAGGIWLGKNIKFNTKVFGDFTIKADSTPPRISYFKTVGKTIYFKMTDNLSGIAHWYAYLNGKFLLMHYDPRYSVIFTNTLNNNEVIKGDLIIGSVDNMGNSTRAKFKF
jgi:hypothetical protein